MMIHTRYVPQPVAPTYSARFAAFAVVAIILLILFEAYRSSFETWIQPATDWLTVNDAWSWTIPTVILILLSFPPLFGHEIVMLFVGVCEPPIPILERVGMLKVAAACISHRRWHWNCLCWCHIRRRSLFVSLGNLTLFRFSSSNSIINCQSDSVVFKYFFTSYVDKKVAQSVRWAATAKITQEAGFRGVLIIRYSIVPPRTLSVRPRKDKKSLSNIP
jgi:hypothetical protein